MGNRENEVDVDNLPNFMKDFVVNKDAGYPFFTPDVLKIKPEPGFCLKTKDQHGSKIFINFCHSTGLPPPKDIGEEELSELLTNSVEETANYRVPISLGEARDVVDKSGNPSMSHDVVINSDFYQKVEKSPLFKNFVIQVAFEGLEEKCKKEFIKTEWIILKNKRYMGSLTDVTVRAPAANQKPLITELSSTEFDRNEVEETKQIKFEEFPPPNYEIIKEPFEGEPTHLVAEFQLPFVTNRKEILLDLGEDRIILCVPNKYFLDIFLPYLVVQDECGAEFNLDSSTLTLTMVVNS